MWVAVPRIHLRSAPGAPKMVHQKSKTDSSSHRMARGLRYRSIAARQGATFKRPQEVAPRLFEDSRGERLLNPGDVMRGEFAEATRIVLGAACLLAILLGALAHLLS